MVDSYWIVLLAKKRKFILILHFFFVFLKSKTKNQIKQSRKQRLKVTIRGCFSFCIDPSGFGCRQHLSTSLSTPGLSTTTRRKKREKEFLFFLPLKNVASLLFFELEETETEIESAKTLTATTQEELFTVFCELI